MRIKYCPKCDNRIKSSFCWTCKTFVKPREVNQTYYLNERHTESQLFHDNCEFHGTSIRSDINNPKSNTINSENLHRRVIINTSNNKITTGKEDKQKGIFAVFITTMIVIIVGIILLEGIYNYAKYDYAGEEDSYLDEEGYVTIDGVLIYSKDGNISDEDMKLLSTPSTGFEHFMGINGENFYTEISEMLENQYQLKAEDNFGYTNNFFTYTDEINTYYETVYIKQYARDALIYEFIVTFDSVSKELSEFKIFGDKKTVIEALKTVINNIYDEKVATEAVQKLMEAEAGNDTMDTDYLSVYLEDLSMYSYHDDSEYYVVSVQAY